MLFFGRLCRASVTTTHKQIFNLRLANVISGNPDKSSLTFDLVQTLLKYDMSSFFENFIEESFIPNKSLWSKVISQTITIYEENKWQQLVQQRPELRRYGKIHRSLTEHRLVRLCSKYQHKRNQLMILTYLGSLAIISGQCSLCNKSIDDLVKHLILHCEYLINDRNSMFYSIVDLVPVQDSVNLFNQEDDDILLTLLGGMTDFANNLDSDLWCSLILRVAGQIHNMYTNFRKVIFEVRFQVND